MADKTAQVEATTDPSPEAHAPGQNEDSGTTSKPAEGEGSKPASTLEALTNRLAEMRAAEKPAEEANAEAKPEGEKEAKAEDEDPGETPEQKAAFKGKPLDVQVKELRAERRATRAKIADLERQVGELSPMKEHAQHYQALSEWATRSGLTQEEFTRGLELTALMKADPFKALEAVTPIYQELQRRAGATLPEDLESAVQTGEITEDRARELARLRREREFLSQRTDTMTAAERQRAEQAQFQQHVDSIRTALNEAERSHAAKDVDYAKKKAWIHDRMMALNASEGVPGTAQEAVERYRKVVKAVTDELASITPRRQATDPLPTPNGGAHVPAPRNTLEAMRARLQAAGRQVVG